MFPDKAGGAPAWLDPVNLPAGDARLCGVCGEPLRFALQVYAPLPPWDGMKPRTRRTTAR
jgi:pre-rRNA-processing protein TSR4